MNELERQVRDTLQRHQDDAPALDISDARRTASRTRRRQARNVVVGTIGAIAVIVAFAGLGGIMRADPSSSVIAPVSLSPTCEATQGSPDATLVHRWPTTSRNQAGVYSWDASADERQKRSSIEGFMHNAYSPGSGRVNVLIEGVAGQLDPHLGETAATVAGCEATYRRFIRKGGSPFRGPAEEWMVDIQGTTVTITIVAERGAPPAEVAEAHEIVDSIRSEPQDNDLGFRLDFTLRTNTWDSG